MVEATFGLTAAQKKKRFFVLQRRISESCPQFVLRVEEARARLGLDKETVMMAFEKQLDGQLK